MKRLQDKLERDLIWRACRRHSLARHTVKAAVVVLGETTSPHWAMFKKVHDNWGSLAKDDTHSGIDYDQLSYYKWGEDSVMDIRARSVLKWGKELLEKETFTRGDY